MDFPALNLARLTDSPTLYVHLSFVPHALNYPLAEHPAALQRKSSVVVEMHKLLNLHLNNVCSILRQKMHCLAITSGHLVSN